MTQTTNIGLKKIDGSENWRQIFDYHNDSADKTDSSVAAVQDGLAIVANGNTHAAVAEGQFVYVRNHSTLAEGLYKASSAIGTNGELTTSNLTADGSGGLNDLQEQVTSLNSNLSYRFTGIEYSASTTKTITLPFEQQNGKTWLIIVKHFTSSTDVVCALYLAYLISGVWSVTAIKDYENLSKLTQITSSGDTVTLTFNGTAYCSAGIVII